MTGRAQDDLGLYDRDFYAWTQQQADLLRRADLDRLDIPHLLEEIESLGRKEVSELRSRLRVLMAHLLKTAHQPAQASRSWRSTILVQRIEIERLVGDNPSLKSRIVPVFAEAYGDARKLAAAETGLDKNRFPLDPPFTPREVLDQDYMPPAATKS